MFEREPWYDKLPSDKLHIYRPNVRLFFETMFERQLIWKRRFKDKLPSPWTNDEILRDFKFTNVYRELDRSSQWQIKNIILDDSLTLKNMIWKMMVFRFFNNPDTFTFEAGGKNVQPSLFGEEIKSGLPQAQKKSDLISANKWKNGIPDYEEYDEDEFSRFIAGVRSAGQNPFTNAYVINSRVAPGQSRDYCYTKIVIPALHKVMDELLTVVKTASSPEIIIEYLKKLPTVADFIAHEFYQDFTYVSRYTNFKFMQFDQNDFTNVGPGASLGIRLIYPNLKGVREQKRGLEQLRLDAHEWLTRLERARGESFPYLGWDFLDKQYFLYDFKEYRKFSADPDARMYSGITLHQIEMWLCEFQKYWKMSIGEGKQRSKFVPKK